MSEAVVLKIMAGFYSVIYVSLIYSGSRNATGTVMEVVNDARGTPKGECDPDSTLIRRYHSCTGRKEKLRTIEGYTKDAFLIISCTNALGLGQDWPTVMKVIVMGRMGLPELAQLFGRIGVIPFKKNDPQVLAEQAREKAAEFQDCKCSNCDSEASDMLVHNMPRLTKSNYCQAMEDVFSVDGFLDPNTEKLEENIVDSSVKTKATKKRSNILDSRLEELTDELVFEDDLFHKYIYGDDDYCFSSDYFGLDRATDIVQSLDEITCEEDIKAAMGGDIIKGGVKAVFEYIKQWKCRDEVIDYRRRQAEVIEKKKEAAETRAQKAIDLKLKAPIHPELARTPAPIKPKTKKRSSEKVKADKEASALRAAYHKRCLHWMTVEMVPVTELDAKELAYQSLMKGASGNVPGDI
ncbi:uncharacterized protein MELLADRAFT_113492 [Melampsora larici-populina 98AG31]|uniref:Helicase C-terminal domain-containing protein n=1 Tax=Melampsora larici-populina (strain 98AG31 / pathotype 3-4-7) TaxID=747676 RepID=F4SA29_MELLP|nr:uncharacterized protein MELLADRAFT_113492 [Melampsora larici-populina 98AG31]EGF98510.1 hypothetical protein MELLADRAFT_113492 [Melampsora larici-populina 98AG31]